MKLNLRARRVSAAAVALAMALCASARAEKMLSAEDAAAGWVNLFDGETLFGWNRIGDADFRVADGKIVCSSGSGGMLATSSLFADFELVLKVKVQANTDEGIVLRSTLDGHPSEVGGGMITIAEPKGAETKEHEVKITADGSSIHATVDGNAVEGLVVSRPKGIIGLQYRGRHFRENRIPGRLEVSEAKLRPLNLKSIFNGKDLSEWNPLKTDGSKPLPSVYSVIDGAINIKNGHGQIETKGTYKNFALQLAIYSNGDHLNSGVFFRGPVGVFWKGYESQVRNQWNGDDRTKAVDFGTGGNYGNQDARKVVSSDREWFYMTVVGDANHYSIWVNGYQTSDFTDVRPIQPENDGKAGYVPGPGTIHLQGHDPTTDLSFKNIRIVEYPK